MSQEPYIIWLWFMVHICKMVISPGAFFIFFKILIFHVVRGVKGQKMVQNDKKAKNCSLSRSISHQPYIIWLSFMVHMFKVIISLGGFSIFSKFWVFVLLGGKGVKNSPKWQKIVCHTPYLRKHTSYDFHLRYTWVKW